MNATLVVGSSTYKCAYNGGVLVGTKVKGRALSDSWKLATAFHSLVRKTLVGNSVCPNGCPDHERDMVSSGANRLGVICFTCNLERNVPGMLYVSKVVLA